MNLFPRIGDLASSLTFLHSSLTRSPDISLCQAMVGRLYLTTFGGMPLGCCLGGRPLILVRLPFMSLFSGTLADFDCPSYNV